jgi:hypothetical protein
MPDLSGDFVTSTDKVGALKLWNVSQKAPKQIIKVGPTGIAHFLQIPFSSQQVSRSNPGDNHDTNDVLFLISLLNN